MAPSRRSKRKGQASMHAKLDNDFTDTSYSVYADMVSEATGVSRVQDERPNKRQKHVDGELQRVDREPMAYKSVASQEEALPPRQYPVQTVLDDSTSSGDSEDDFDWEEVDLEANRESSKEDTDQSAYTQDVSIVIGNTGSAPNKPAASSSRRLPSSVADKRLRLDIHKLHTCCLLVHLHIRNAWCNDASVQGKLKRLLPRRTISFLKPSKTHSQFQQSRSFVDGLQQVIDVWKPLFKIDARGTRRPNWTRDVNDLEQEFSEEFLEPVTSRADFISAAEQRRGSRDTGAQLFCALLRSAGVDARLVCSLQPLSFASTSRAISSAPSKKSVIYADESTDSGGNEEGKTQNMLAAVIQQNTSTSSSTPVSRIRRLGQPSHIPIPDAGRAPEMPVKRKKIVDSPFPVYWVEAFNEALQKWIPVDPLVTGTIGKPMKFEPPASDAFNDMIYVIAFEEDGIAKDVTRRYAKAYNAKTRRRRVEAAKDGRKWWKKVMRAFDDGLEADRDQVENAELATREAAEPMPRNVQDFKDHPYYALERHLRRNEVIHPKQEVGKVSAGKSASFVESIYRRQHVQVVRTADKWYRYGREVKPSEQPLKYAIHHRRRLRDSSLDHEASGNESDDQQGAALYAIFQTDLYVPPAIIKGNVPRNQFGNLDVYVPSMIPPGGVHIRVAEASQAARILQLDYADAVTGFEFRGRHGTAIINGIVIAQEYQEAVEEVVRALRWQREQAVATKRSAEALQLWKRFLTGLKIRDRIMGYAEADKDESKQNMEAQLKNLDMDGEEEFLQTEGGFLPDQDGVKGHSLLSSAMTNQQQDPIKDTNVRDSSKEFRTSHIPVEYEDVHYDYFPASVLSPWKLPLVAQSSKSRLPHDKTEEVTEPFDLFEDAGNLGGGFIQETENVDTDMGGGFIPEDDHHTTGSGGFITEEQKMYHGNRKSDSDVNDTVGESGLVQEVGDGNEDGLPLPTQSVEATSAHESELAPSDRENGDRAFEDLSSTQRKISSQDRNDNSDYHQRMQEKTNISETTYHSGEHDTYNDEENREKGTREEYKHEDSDADEIRSLLSEDPEDEDAEPEWLVNDVGF